MKQREALEILKMGENVFLTGPAGSGKTHVLNEYVSFLKSKGVEVGITASTGIAATHIGGLTIHAWSGIGVRDELTRYDLDKLTTSEKTGKRVKKAKVLIIDEVSMLDGKILNMLDQVTKAVRQSTEPFGGLQTIFVGDFFQLPPVTRQGGVMRYAFESEAWQGATPLICYLTEQHRQEDEMFLGLLKSIRKNEIEEDHYTLLQEQTEIGYEDIEPTKLYTHNADVDAFNEAKLKSLGGSSVTFKMETNGPKALTENLVRTCLSPQVLELKEEAMVMCTKNNFEAGYVNGTLGRIIRFDGEGWPVIKTSTGRELTIKPTSWEVVEDGKVRASIEQVPLRLAWAITVHKSQGMSLDAAEIDLSKAFVYGQGYVALSRVRTLVGLKLSGMHPNALSVDPRIIAQDSRFMHESESAEEAFETMASEEIVTMQKKFVEAIGGKWPKEEDIKAGRVHERIKKESTLETTKELLTAKKTVTKIAKERKMNESTIWSHLEKLAEAKEITENDLVTEQQQISNWKEAYTELKKHMDEVGTEKLKPIYEAAGEKHSYETVRLARIIYQLSKN